MKAARRRQPEAALQRAVAQYLDAALMLPAIWTHVPSGGKRDAKTGAQLKAAGLKPGWPDALILHGIDLPDERSDCRVLAIELKAESGSLSKEQKKFRDNIRRLGGAYEICKSVEDVQRACLAWGVPIKARVV